MRLVKLSAGVMGLVKLSALGKVSAGAGGIDVGVGRVYHGRLHGSGKN